MKFKVLCFERLYFKLLVSKYYNFESVTDLEKDIFEMEMISYWFGFKNGMISYSYGFEMDIIFWFEV